jgi:anti-anti-sigma factor
MIKVRYIELSGEYDLARKQELAAEFAVLSNGDPLAIDMRRVTYVDSTFLNELATLRLRLDERSVTLVGVRPNILRILQLVKFDRFFTFSDGL